MTDKELMQMALDALDSDCDATKFGASEALRARLAQPEPDDGYCQACDGNNCTAKDGCVARDNPPPQREWQGLTDEEILEEYRQSYGDDGNLTDVYFARAIEAKLKEKNT